MNGDWLFQQDKGTAWKTVQVPSSFQSHEGTNFHGIGWYRKTINLNPVPAGKRLLLHFQAAATEAEVWWDGQRLGSHLGGWTPFRFDLTDLLKNSPPSQPHELRVRLDEKVGHNSQGFLPIIAPHFGGLWQEVALLEVPDTYIDDLGILAVGDVKSGQLRLDLPLAGNLASATTNLIWRCRLRGEETWIELTPRVQLSNGTLRASAPLAMPRLWSPDAPNLYELEISLGNAGGDRFRTRAAFRAMETFGPEFRLNGWPLQLRGLLNWGYSPPQVEPNPGEAVWRSELEFAKARGFNLMKFCLWVPPQSYLELADEMGMLTWMEYPTWHPDFSEKFLEPLRHEFAEFFRYDRNHPSTVLRSLTCETGPSADLKVIQSLYHAAHELVPGALVEDDSSWIEWNRVHDFYDDHPYGNNHTWIKTLDGFNDYILAHGLKPLVLGEAIAADTWLDRDALLKHFGRERPWYAPSMLDDTLGWLEKMRQLAGPGGLDSLRADSLTYGMLMRKYQAEAFRREIPYGGYVISVIRDIPNASMGLLDYLDRAKWTEADWRWQRDTICLLKTDGDQRSFSSGGQINGAILLSHFAKQPIAGAQLRVSLATRNPAAPVLERLEQKDIGQNPGTLANLLVLNWQSPQVTAPTQLVIRAELASSTGEFHNEWPIWVVPQPATPLTNLVRLHHSLNTALRQELFPGCSSFEGKLEDKMSIVVASRFDDDLVRFLEQSGRVLFLPDGQKDSLPLSAHWFLRGGPYIPQHALSAQVPRELLIQLQHFDLAADVVPNVPCLDAFDPILMLWDTHDQQTVRTHGVIFETRASQGRLLVSAARHAGNNNPAGRWLLGVLLQHLRSGELPRHALSADVWSYLKAKLHAEQTNLVTRAWKFKPDPGNEGLAQGWNSPAKPDSDWKDIRIGAWWESQGYLALDGLAWYRLWVDIPSTWQGKDVFLSFEGVDDSYDLYINGHAAGQGGDRATHHDALQEKKSHNISRWVTPGQKALIAVRVNDWGGAGGIFRPVTLGTLPFRPELDLLN